MPNTNDFVPFAIAGGSNVVSQAQYLADSVLETGFQTGVAPSAKLNKVWRQSSFVMSAIAQLMKEVLAQDILDNGVITTFQKQFASAINLSNYGHDTGGLNSYAVEYAIPVSGLYDGLKLRFKAASANTVVPTFSPNGLPSAPIYSAMLQPLTGGEIAPNSIVDVVWNSSLNTTGAWVLMAKQGAGRSAYVKQSSLTIGTSATQTNTLSFTAPSSGFLTVIGAMNTSGLSTNITHEVRINGTQYGSDIVNQPSCQLGSVAVVAGAVMTIVQNVISGAAPTGAFSIELTYIFTPA